MSFADITGTLAMIFSIAISIGMIFQVRKIRKRKSSKDISIILYCAILGELLFWMLNGIATRNIYLVISHGIGLVLVLITLAFILKYRK